MVALVLLAQALKVWGNVWSMTKKSELLWRHSVLSIRLTREHFAVCALGIEQPFSKKFANDNFGH